MLPVQDSLSERIAKEQSTDSAYLCAERRNKLERIRMLFPTEGLPAKDF